MLFAWLLIGGPVTGAHYNPAVSVGILVSNAAMAKMLVKKVAALAGKVTFIRGSSTSSCCVLIIAHNLFSEADKAKFSAKLPIKAA